MLPEPWRMPDYLFDEFINSESKYDPELFMLMEERDQLDDTIEYKLEIANKAANKWWEKVVRMMRRDGYKMNTIDIAGLNLNRDRKQIEFLDGYDMFCHHIRDLPDDEQERLQNGFAPYFQRQKPSKIQIDQIVEDLISNTINDGGEKK